MSHSARYERGLAKFVEMYGEQTKTFLASLEGIAPDLGTYVMEFAFGDIHCRPGLSLQSREIATIAALTAFAQGLDKDILGANRTQQRHASITTDRNEVKMSAPADANELVGHGVEGHQNPDSSSIAKGLPPEIAEPVTRS